jgi:hypothetical protein
MTQKSWAEASPGQRLLVVLGGIVQMGLLVAAQVDITRRPAAEIRGSKRMWRAVSLINFFGPIAYFVRGRRT